MNRDITIFIEAFIGWFLDIWDWVWQQLDNIKIGGTSLYWIIITIIILRIGIPIMIQLHNDTKLGNEKIKRKSEKNARRNNNSSNK